MFFILVKPNMLRSPLNSLRPGSSRPGHSIGVRPQWRLDPGPGLVEEASMAHCFLSTCRKPPKLRMLETGKILLDSCDDVFFVFFMYIALQHWG